MCVKKKRHSLCEYPKLFILISHFNKEQLNQTSVFGPDSLDYNPHITQVTPKAQKGRRTGPRILLGRNYRQTLHCSLTFNNVNVLSKQADVFRSINKKINRLQRIHAKIHCLLKRREMWITRTNGSHQPRSLS